MAVEYLGTGQPDGTSMGRTDDKISFYGVTPIVRAAAVTTLATTPTATDVGTAVNSIISRLQTLGLIS